MGGGDQKVSFFRLFAFADKLDVLLIIVGTIGAVGNGLSQPLMTVIFSNLINAFGKSTGHSVTTEVSKVCLHYVYLAIGAGIASFLQLSCWMVSGERQAARIRGLYLKTILRQEIAFFDTETTTGEVVGRMSGDTILIQDAIGEKVGKFIQLMTTFLGGFVIAYIRGWKLALVLTSCIPALVISGGFMALVMAKMSSHGQVAYSQAGNVVEQTVGGIRTVASFTGEKNAMDKYNSKLRIAYTSTKHSGMASGLGIGTIICLVLFTYGLATWYGSKLIIHGGYDGGKVLNVIMSIITGGISLGQTSPCTNAFAAGQAAAYKMFETIERTPKIDTYDTGGVVLDIIKGDIELKDVYFKYPSRPDVQIFSGFSLKIPGGVTAALVGQSGSGKSTVISLLERFYDPDAGEVFIDGVNLKNMKLKWIRDQMGLVSQEPILFGTSIKENIAYGKENATKEEIRTAIELANAAKFIDKLPEGLGTMVGEHGTQMSGGQKQRIAIARAILKNPKILLLDEATSALDAESERIVQNALDKVMANRTTVVVAHRLTTIQNADIIAVVHLGKLVEQGTHDELIKNPEGAYTQLVQMQGGSNNKNTDNNEAEENTNVNVAKEDRMSLSLPRSISRSSSRGIAARRSTGTCTALFAQEDWMGLSLPRSISRSSSRGMTARRSTGSSQKSFAANDAVQVCVDIYEGLVGDQQNDDGLDDGRDTQKSQKNVSIRRLAYLNRPELPVLVFGSVAACVHGVIFPVFGLLISQAIKIFYESPHQLRRDSRFWALMFVSLGVITLVAIPIQNFLFGIAGGKLIQRIRSLSFQKIVYQDISWFDDPTNSSGAVGARLSTDASTVRNLVGDALALVVQNIATIVSGLVIAFTANWLLAIITLAVLPLIGIQSFLQTKLHKGFSADAKVMYEEASQVANDAVGSIRTVASFCAEEKVMDMYQKKCDGPVKSGVWLGIVSGIAFGLGSCALYLVNSFIFYIGSVLEKHGLATFPEVFKIFFALSMTAIGITQTSGMVSDFNKAKHSVTSIFNILDSKPKRDSSKDEGSTLESVKGDIELQHISFKYPTRPNIPIFKDLCLSMPSGKTVALVGESGSGKSTVISLIERFYDPDSGHIYLDGVEIRNLKLHWLRQQMGLVSQEPVLFNETIRDNIAYGKEGSATEEEIIAATKLANAHNFISALPQGYNTSVGERGLQLSGGQKQRIAIARAIIKDPKILLLDEATSALDTESERIVQDALDSIMVNRTTVVVAHRLATIRGADMIAVVKNGVVAEKGTHDVLMKITDGVYASLVALQMSSN